MQTRLFLVASVLAVLVVGSCTTDGAVSQFYVPEYSEPIYGTWVNEGYPGNPYYPQKFIVFNWGYAENYNKMADDSCSHRNTFILICRWEDAEGNTWYTDFEQTSSGYRVYTVNRISKDGRTYELMIYPEGLPEEYGMDSSASNYRIYHRQ